MSTEFIELLRPNNVNHTKVRIGPPEDGGYVITNEMIADCTTLMTYGVGHDTRFEEQFTATYHKPALLFDHTIGSAPWERGALKFVPEGLGYHDKCKEWYQHYLEFDVAGKVILKIDVEEYEYEYFKMTDVAAMAPKVSGILLEVHWIDSDKNRAALVEILTAIQQHFSLIHIHGNNWGGTWDFDGKTIPKVLELTFVNKSLVDTEEVDTQDYPIVGLDLPNKPDSEDYTLDFIK